LGTGVTPTLIAIAIVILNLRTSDMGFQIGGGSRSILLGAGMRAELQQAISARKLGRQTPDKQTPPDVRCSAFPSATATATARRQHPAFGSRH
jgi:hypothetical protein